MVFAAGTRIQDNNKSVAVVLAISNLVIFFIGENLLVMFFSNINNEGAKEHDVKKNKKFFKTSCAVG